MQKGHHFPMAVFFSRTLNVWIYLFFNHLSSSYFGFFFVLHAFNFLVHYSLFILVCFILFFLLPFFVLKVFFFFSSSPSFSPPSSFHHSFPSSLLFCTYFFVSCVSLLCHAINYSLFHASPCCLFYPSHFTLLLHVLSLTFYPATTSSLPLCFPMLLPTPSFVFCLVVCSFPHTSLCSCLLPPLHFTLQLPDLSFMLGLVATCSFLCTSPYYCLLLPSCFALLPTYSFTPHPTFNLKTKILLPLPPPCCFTTCSFTLHLDVCLVSTNTSPPLSSLQVKELGSSLELEAFLFW